MIAGSYIFSPCFRVTYCKCNYCFSFIVDFCLLFATFCHLLHRLDPALPLFSRGSLQEIMNLIRSDYLKEVAVSAVFFGCRRKERMSRRKAANRTSGEGSDMRRVCHVITVRLTVGHEIYSCDHRTTERDGTQRIVIILTGKEREP